MVLVNQHLFASAYKQRALQDGIEETDKDYLDEDKSMNTGPIVIAILIGTFLILCSQCLCFYNNKCFRDTMTSVCKCYGGGGGGCEIIACLLFIICCPCACMHQCLVRMRTRSREEVEAED